MALLVSLSNTYMRSTSLTARAGHNAESRSALGPLVRAYSSSGCTSQEPIDATGNVVIISMPSVAWVCVPSVQPHLGGEPQLSTKGQALQGP